MTRKLGPDDFAKGMMFLAILIAGILIGAATGGWANLQAWTSALSGRFAGGVALWIGITQLGPLLLDMKEKSTQSKAQKLETIVEIRKKLRNHVKRSNHFRAVMHVENPLVLLADSCSGDEYAIAEKIYKFFDDWWEAAENIDYLIRSTHWTAIGSENLSRAASEVKFNVIDIQRETLDFCGKITEIREEFFLNRNIPLVEKIEEVIKKENIETIIDLSKSFSDSLIALNRQLLEETKSIEEVESSNKH
ncbi:hypothetical protein [uncultured Roseibium sp.]|uniref:hypothetical protein n=1 Tax=uncultured Roseibium sp. TaxID=1936171 RepID=UPI00261A5308|nr:hypothetical protein [uncultured Roseibium sp.]